MQDILCCSGGLVLAQNASSIGAIGWRVPYSSMNFRGDTTMTERHLNHSETLSNGCKIEVKARILRDGSLQMFIGVYRPDGTVIVEDNHPAPNQLDMEAALEWGIVVARNKGNSQNLL
jgi:hypothetical protein